MLLLVAAGIHLYRNNYAPHPQTPEINKQFQRLVQVSRDLPQGARVGYWCGGASRDFTGVRADGTRTSGCVALYEMTRFILFPRILVQGVDSEWVVGDFDNGYAFDRSMLGFNLQVAAEYGDGIYLFRRVR